MAHSFKVFRTGISECNVVAIHKTSYTRKFVEGFCSRSGCVEVTGTTTVRSPSIYQLDDRRVRAHLERRMGTDAGFSIHIHARQTTHPQRARRGTLQRSRGTSATVGTHNQPINYPTNVQTNPHEPLQVLIDRTFGIANNRYIFDDVDAATVLAVGRISPATPPFGIS